MSQSTDISTLPNELLTKIFSLLQDQPSIRSRRQLDSRFGTDRDLLNLGSRLDWIVITYVCRHWRNVALEDPTLWTHIGIRLGPQWMEQFLQRARMAPLAIDYRFPSPQVAGDLLEEYNRLATILFCHLDHIQQLDIDGAVYGLEPVVGCLNSPAPLLQSVAVSAWKYGHGPDIEMPTTLFGRNAPRLRQLRLRKAAIPWISLTPFTTLTHLEIQLSENGGSPAFDMARGRAGFKTFLCALEQLTALEKLALHHCIPSLLSDRGSSTITCPAVELPHLKWLRLHLDVMTFAATMNHLVVPADTRIDLNLSIPPTMKAGYGLVLTWLRSHAPNFAPIQSFAFREHCPGGMEIVARDTCDLSLDTPLRHDFDEDDAPMLRMILRSHHRSRDFVDQMGLICEVLHLEYVQRIDVFVNMYWTPQDWLDFFGGSRRVEYVLVGSRCAYSFFDALAANCNPDDASKLLPADVELLFPSLGYLELRVVDFSAYAGEDECMLETIRDAIWLRSNTAPLDTLRIQACRVRAEEVDRLRDVVSHVLWDEEGSGYATSDDFFSQSDDDDDDL